MTVTPLALSCAVQDRIDVAIAEWEDAVACHAERGRDALLVERDAAVAEHAYVRALVFNTLYHMTRTGETA